VVTIERAFVRTAPNSAAHPEPLKRRTVSFPSSRLLGGRGRYVAIHRGGASHVRP
jgi:hypothetical protein